MRFRFRCQSTPLDKKSPISIVKTYFQILKNTVHLLPNTGYFRLFRNTMITALTSWLPPSVYPMTPSHLLRHCLSITDIAPNTKGFVAITVCVSTVFKKIYSSMYLNELGLLFSWSYCCMLQSVSKFQSKHQSQAYPSKERNWRPMGEIIGCERSTVIETNTTREYRPQGHCHKKL